jgi:hypothetical protein
MMPNKMKIEIGKRASCWIGIAGVLFAPAVDAGAREENGTNWQDEFVIPVADEKPAAMQVKARLAEDLAEVKAERKLEVKSLVAKDVRYVLYGDLFKTGGCFALYETSLKEEGEMTGRSASMALAEWVEGKWELRGAWRLPVLWLEKGRKWDGEDGGQYFPVEPAHEPFVLRELSGDAVPEVVVAGEVSKYFQTRYLMCYRPESHGLALVADSMGMPERAGKYVRLYTNSGHRSIWEEWSFSEWEGGKLVEKVSWHAEAPYNDIDPPFREAVLLGGKSPVTFRVTEEDSEVVNADAYVVTRNGQPFARVVVMAKPGEQDLVNGGTAEDAWFFEKLTGLKRDMFPDTREGKKPAALEKHATIRVTGGKEARKRFAAGG